MSGAVKIIGDRMEVGFDSFGLEEYSLFLKTKALPEASIEFDHERETYRVIAPARFAAMLGAEPPAARGEGLPMHEGLFDYQRWIVRDLALPAKRFAVWADCGLGKTLIFLEWARQVAARTGGKVLVTSPNSVIGQTIEEAENWYGSGLPIHPCETRAGLVEWCKSPAGSVPAVGIVNYEKFIGEEESIPELRWLAGIAADEASILKTGGGKIKWSLIKSARGVEYKLSLTATPAPNDTMEYASQGSFLEKLRSEGEIIWTFFNKDGDGNWQVKPHARDGLFRFMAGWSVFLRDPAAYGFEDGCEKPPEPEYFEEEIEPTREQLELAAAEGIAETDVLDGWRGAREEGDEKHVCPLQLEVIRRCVMLYSNPGELVLDPYMGIGSTAWVALGGQTTAGETVGQPRRAIGFELKESYHRQAVRNAGRAIEQGRSRAGDLIIDNFAGGGGASTGIAGGGWPC